MSTKKFTMADQATYALKELYALYEEVDASTAEIARKRAGEIVFKEAMVSLMVNDVITETLNPVIIMSGNILNTYWEKLLETESSPEFVMGMGILDLFGVEDDEESSDTETAPESKDDTDKTAETLSDIERKILSEKLETKLWEEYGASLLDTSIPPHKMVEILDYIPTPEYTKDDFAILLKANNLLKEIKGFILSEEAQGKQVNLAAFAKILPVHIKNNSETN